MKSFALVSLFIASVASYSAGPPSFVCNDPFLKPKHDGNDFQTSPSPFEKHIYYVYADVDRIFVAI